MLLDCTLVDRTATSSYSPVLGVEKCQVLGLIKMLDFNEQTISKKQIF